MRHPSRVAALAAAFVLVLPATAAAALVPIHDVQGAGFASPLAGQRVTVDGVITGRTADGLFVQAPVGTEDADPATSEGLYLHLGAPPAATFAVGDRIRANGVVEEYVGRPDDLPVTRLALPTLVPVAKGVPLPAPVRIAFDAMPAEATFEYFERLEGMRVDPTLQVTGPSGGGYDPETGLPTPDGVFHALFRSDAIPVVREAGIGVLDPQPIPDGKTPAIWDQNPEVLRIDSTALGGTPVETWDRYTWWNAPSIVHFADGRHTLLTEPGNVWLNVGGGPSNLQPGFGMSRGAELGVFRIDLGGLWDDVDDPARDEPVPSDAVIEARMRKLERAMCFYLGKADVVALTGVESKRALDRFVAFVNSMPSGLDSCHGAYTAFTAESSSADGLDLGLIVRTQLVEPGQATSLRSATVIGAGATFAAPDGTTTPLFPRPPQLYVLRFRGYDTTKYVDFSLLNVDIEAYAKLASFAPGEHGWESVRAEATMRRREQARWLATWLQNRQKALPDEALMVVGGFEANAAGDGRVDVLGAIAGHEQSKDDVLWPVGVGAGRPLTILEPVNGEQWNPTAFVDGNRIRLDHVLVTEGFDRRILAVPGEWVFKVNVGYPTSWSGDRFSGPFGFSEHEPAVAYLLFPDLLSSDLWMNFGLPRTADPRFESRFRVAVHNAGPTDAYLSRMAIESTLPAGAWSVDDKPPASTTDWECGPPVAVTGGSRAECEVYWLSGDTYEHVDNFSEVALVVPANPALDGVTAGFVATVATTFAETNYANDAKRASIRFSQDVDMAVRAFGFSATADPGEDAFVGFGVTKPIDRLSGTVTVHLDVNAPPAQTALQQTGGNYTCAPPVATAAGSRITCTVPPTRAESVAYGVVTVKTGAGDTGRRITLKATVQSTIGDPDLENNVARASTRVGGDGFDATAAVFAKKSIPAGTTSAVTIQTTFQGTPPSSKPMRLRVTLQSALPLGGATFAPPGWTCARSGTLQALAFDCTATSGVPPATASLALKVQPAFAQGGVDTVRIRAEYSHPAAGDEESGNDRGEASVAIAPARAER